MSTVSTSPKTSPTASAVQGSSKVEPFDEYADLANQYFASIAPLKDEDIPAAAAKLAIIAEDVNGPNTFSLESAAYGYIEKYHRLIVPASLKDEIEQDGTSSLDVMDMFTIMYYNFMRLRKGGMTESDAYFTAAYRARLIERGYLYPDKKTRSVTIDEVDWPVEARNYSKDLAVSNRDYDKVRTGTPDDEDLISSFLKHAPETPYRKFVVFSLAEKQMSVLRHMTFAAEQYAASTYLVFRQHGHHYKSEFEMKYNVLWRATTIDRHDAFPGNEVIHRLAIHSFGVKCLHVKFFENLNKSKLAETFVDRSDVAPAGTAVIATCNASFQLMRSLPMWNDMYQSYKAQIDSLTEQALLLKDAKDSIKYHKNAGLFGVVRHKLDASVAQALAPVAKGFINSLGDASDLSKQRALDKRAQQNPLIVMTIQAVIEKLVRAARRDADFKSLSGVKREAIQDADDEDSEDEDE